MDTQAEDKYVQQHVHSTRYAIALFRRLTVLIYVPDRTGREATLRGISCTLKSVLEKTFQPLMDVFFIHGCLRRKRIIRRDHNSDNAFHRNMDVIQVPVGNPMPRDEDVRFHVPILTLTKLTHVIRDVKKECARRESFVSSRRVRTRTNASRRSHGTRANLTITTLHGLG